MIAFIAAPPHPLLEDSVVQAIGIIRALEVAIRFAVSGERISWFGDNKISEHPHSSPTHLGLCLMHPQMVFLCFDLSGKNVGLINTRTSSPALAPVGIPDLEHRRRKDIFTVDHQPPAKGNRAIPDLRV